MTTDLTLADQFRMTAALCDYPDPLTREVMLCLAPLAVPTSATTASVSVSLFHLTRVVDMNRPMTTLGDVLGAVLWLEAATVIDARLEQATYSLEARIDLSPLPRRRSSGAHCVEGQEISQTFRTEEAA